MTTTELLIVARRRLTDTVTLFELSSASGAPLPMWTPGAHITLHLDGMSREYSLCGPLHDPDQRWQLAVQRCYDGRGGSAYVHDSLEVGSRVTASGPRNHFELAPAKEYCFIAGGIGITPILPMIERADSLGIDWKLVYLGKNSDSMPFHDELLAKYDARVQVHLSASNRRLPLSALVSRLDRHTAVYCCGPESLLSELEALCEHSAVELHLERFSPIAVDGTREPFDVVVAGDNTLLHVPADRTLLDVLLEADFDVFSSCEEGTCGTCEIAVLQGVPDHRDSVLTSAEHAANDRMMPCVSRCRSDRLVVQL